MRGVIFWLFTLSCMYLGLPYVCFFYGWLRWWAAVPATGLLVYAAAGAIRQVKQSLGRYWPKSEKHPVLSKKAFWGGVFLWIGVCLGLMSLSGIGGVGPQKSDYLKHNAVLKHLIESAWPVWTTTDRGEFPLVYYTAWYLPPALVGKWAGWYWANAALFLWTLLGLLLSAAWFVLLVGRCGWIVLAAFFLCSGADVVGAGLAKLASGQLPVPGWSRSAQVDPLVYRWWYWNLGGWVEVPGSLKNYGHPIQFLFWTPQHLLGSWLCSAMTIGGFLRPWFHWRRWAALPLALSALWTPFATLGLAPYVAAKMLVDWRKTWKRTPQSVGTETVEEQSARAGLFRRGILQGSTAAKDLLQKAISWLTGINGASLTVLALVCLYYASRFAGLPFVDHPQAKFRFLGLGDRSLGEYVLRLLCFWAVEVGLLAWATTFVRPPRKLSEKVLFYTTILVLLILPLFWYGQHNDLVMRASIPGLFVLAIFLAKAAGQKQAPLGRRIILWGVMAISAIAPLVGVASQMDRIWMRGQWIATPSVEIVPSLWELNVLEYRRKWGRDWFIRQYIGNPNAFFFRRLAPCRPESPPEKTNP